MPDRTIKQHFVPQFLLRNFCGPEGNIWVFDKVRSSSFAARANDIASERYFYDHIQIAQTTGDPQCIEREFSKAEGRWHKALMPVIDRVRKCHKPKISNTERMHISEMIAFQYIRTRKFRDEFRRTWKRLIDTLSRHPRIPKEALAALVEQEGYLNETETIHHLNLIMNDDDTGEVRLAIYNLVWIFFRVGNQGNLYISDNPLVRCPHILNRMAGGDKPGSRGIELHFPLSHDIVLAMFDGNYHRLKQPFNGLSIEMDSAEDRIYYNEKQAQMADRFIYSLGSDFQDAKMIRASLD